MKRQYSTCAESLLNLRGIAAQSQRNPCSISPVCLRNLGGVRSKVLSVGEFASVQNAEVEDLIPFDLLQKPIERLLRNDEEDEFEDEYNPEQPIIPQIENFAKSHNVVLPHGYKVDIAKQVKQSMLKKKGRDVDSSSEAVWITLFEKLLT